MNEIERLEASSGFSSSQSICIGLKVREINVRAPHPSCPRKRASRFPGGLAPRSLSRVNNPDRQNALGPGLARKSTIPSCDLGLTALCSFCISQTISAASGTLGASIAAWTAILQ